MKQWIVALRAVYRRPAYSFTALLILIVGIGATSTIFSLVDTILVRPLAYPDSHRLVTVLEASPSLNKNDSLIAPARLEDWNRLNQTFTAIAGIYAENLTDTSGREPERFAVWRVSARFFDVYGSRPLIGRTPNPQEEVSGGALTAVISYGLWTRRYGQDSAVPGKRLVIGGAGYTIIGVMPKEFARPNIDVWIPAQTHPSMLRQREARYFSGVGRMKSGVAAWQAQADLARVQRGLGEQFPQTDKGWSVLVGDLKETRVGAYRRTLWLVFGAVALLMLIAVTNIAGLTLAQLHQRAHELAIRSAVGASRWQVVATMTREVLLIAAGGCAIGGAAATGGVKLVASLFGDLPRMAELHFDSRALLFTVVVSIMAAIVFGAVPAIQSTRADLAPLLVQSSRSVTGGNRRLQHGLVVAQLAITMVLLASAGLLLRSYHNLSQVSLGFDPTNTITFHVGASYSEDRPLIGQLQLRIVEELQRLQGVESVGTTSALPVTGATMRAQVQVEGLAATMDAGSFTIGGRTIAAGYLHALKVPLLAGAWCPALRPFESNGANKSLVNRQFVEQYAKGQNILGRHTRYPGSILANAPMNEIVGVVGDMREDSLSEAPAPYVYDCASAGSVPDPEYVIRTNGDPSAIMREVPRIVHGIDPNRAIFGLKLLDTLVDDALVQQRLNGRFLVLFATAAMLLASVGLYSLISIVVTARRREIGVRIALGASSTEIMGMVFAGAARMLAGGVVAGLALTLAAEQVIKASLFGVSPLDAPTISAAIAVLCAVCLLAVVLPARRASTIDPLAAIRAH